MTLWLTALLVWMAAGARVGRVLVKPATTARVAIVIAVAAVALAATVAVPEIAVAIDNLLPGGVHAGWLSDGVVVSAWIAFVTATSVVASAAWPVVSRRNLRQVALVIYSLGLFAVAATIAWSFTFGWEVVAFGAVFIVITGLRNLDWTTLGRGIAIYTTGTAVVAVLAVLQVRRAFNDAPRVAPGNPTWAWPAWEAASLLIAFGAVWIVVELWVRARVLLRQIRLLHKIMVGPLPRSPSRTTRPVPRLSCGLPIKWPRSWTRCISSPAVAWCSPRWRRRRGRSRSGRARWRSGRETLWAMWQSMRGGLLRRRALVRGAGSRPSRGHMTRQAWSTPEIELSGLFRRYLAYP
ncbi:hypothetical protein [Nocardia brasiliensis]|uniref:hypothetical protein n=1 Tax=Nocardia brasiliensis TaxID=37326 RepID=UPI000A82ADBE|nr:hypothetical protein [Nocardia brasiliensis]